MKKEWIQEGITPDAIQWADEFGHELTEGGGKNALTTSQLRKFFGVLKRIKAEGYDRGYTEFLMLQPKLAYAVGRHYKERNGRPSEGKGIHDFAEKITEGMRHVNNEKSFKNFVNLVEATVAYHKKYGGK